MDYCRPYLTTYRKDYVKKKIERYTKEPFLQEFADPLAESYKKYLTLDESEDKLIPPTEDGEKYIEKYKETNRELGERYFSDGLDKNVIFTKKIYSGKTEYQTVFCDIIAEIKKQEKLLKNNTRLSDNIWLPLTTYTSAYRDPRTSGVKLKRIEPIKASNNLVQNKTVNKILNIRTGETEYMNAIGKLGEFIVTEQMHGKIIHPPCTCAQHNSQ